MVLQQQDDVDDDENGCWEVLNDGSSLFATSDGYTSNNIDGTLLVYRKTSG